ncbi:MAG: NUDIX hydrolase [Chloroflexi bacterium]|jgi:ADP-ribose pyrophosphatase|nr:NUDIX hydrolase [Chloroflexota bacterium]
MNKRKSLPASLQKYLVLLQDHPRWFRNTGEEGEIRIITDPERILTEQDRLRARLQAEGKPPSWIEIGVLAEDEWFYVLRDLVEFPDGKVGGYIRWINRKSQEAGGWNVILMCLREDRVLLIRKFRHERRGWSWEFPRGFGEAGLTPEETALLELREEIGVHEAELTRLASIQEDKGGTVAFLAKIAAAQEIVLDSHEGIQTFEWVSKETLETMIKTGQFSDPFSLWAYLAAKISSLC